MAAAAPFVKLLRQLSGARDDYRTGAFDITWEGGKASLFFVFGQPNHAVLDTGEGRHLEGQEALAGLVGDLPRQFQISPWRKEVVRTETLQCSLDDLMEPFAQLAGSASPAPPASDGAAPAATASGPEVDFGLEDFPLLPLGTTLWADAAASVVHLDVLVPSLPDALVVLTGSHLRAAGIVSHQRMVDAVWVDDETRCSGEQAIMNMMAAGQGTISGYRLETTGFTEALPMLWRHPVAHRALPLAWIDPSGFTEDLENRRRDVAIIVTGPETHGVALWVDGALLAVYSERERQPTASRERLLDLLRTPGARLTLRQPADGERPGNLPETSFHAFVAPVMAGTAAEPDGSTALAASPPPLDVPPAVEPGPPDAPGEDGEEMAESASGAAGTEPLGAPTAVDAASRAGDAPSRDGEDEEEDDVPRWTSAASLSWTEDAVSSASPGSAETTPDEGAGGAVRDDSGEPSAPSPPADEPRGWEAEDEAEGTDFDGVKKDLTQILTLWLGSESAAAASELIERTRPTVGDIMTTIDAIAALPLPGHEPSVIQAMAREMRFHAAEYLSGV